MDGRIGRVAIHFQLDLVLALQDGAREDRT